MSSINTLQAGISPSNIRSFTLSSGHSMPSIGLGTSNGDFQEVVKLIKNAIDSGYRHIDTAAFYQNEEMVGEAIKVSNITRGDFFITTKLWCTDLLPERVRPALELSLKKLQVEYVDLYLIHWPVAFKSPQTTPPEVIPVELSETWKELEALCFEGKIKSIGVSNFTIKKLEKLLEIARIKPAVNQVELHPYLTQLDLKKYCDEKDILLTAYSPLGRSKEPRIDSNPTILQISEKYKKTPAQIMLNWAVQRGTAVVPRSSHLQRQKDNLEQFSLEQSDMDLIFNLNRDHRYILNPQWGIKDLFSD